MDDGLTPQAAAGGPGRTTDMRRRRLTRAALSGTGAVVALLAAGTINRLADGGPASAGPDRAALPTLGTIPGLGTVGPAQIVALALAASAIRSLALALTRPAADMPASREEKHDQRRADALQAARQTLRRRPVLAAMLIVALALVPLAILAR